MSKEVIIIGAGGHGKVIADIVEKKEDIVLGFLDDARQENILQYPILGRIDDCINYKDKWFVIGIGNNSVRKLIAEKYRELHYYTAIHPSANISTNVKVDAGTCIMAGASVNTSAVIKKHCIINTNAVIEHDCTIEDYVHISPGCAICGTVHIGRAAHIGAGATIINNHNIHEDVIIGAGGVVDRDITESGVYAGVPVKKIR